MLAAPRPPVAGMLTKSGRFAAARRRRSPFFALLSFLPWAGRTKTERTAVARPAHTTSLPSHSSLIPPAHQ
eukprot:scaffold10011_cov97-Isochrysis_galbana.AAC.4